MFLTTTKPRNAIIVGMPRSGTSLAAGIFGRCGYYVTADSEKELRGGDEFNPFGYWEAEPLIERNVKALRRAGYTHHNTWMFAPIEPGMIEHLRTLEPDGEDRAFLEGYRKHEPWVWKDPRFCFTLPYWWKIMDSQTTAVLWMRRSPEGIFRSFERIRYSEDQTRESVYARVAAHERATETAIRDFNIPHLVLEYEEVLKSPAGAAARIGETFGLKLTAADLNVDPSLDHSTFTRRALFSLRRQVVRFSRPIRAGLKRVIRPFTPPERDRL